jgi:hypothetical protein
VTKDRIAELRKVFGEPLEPESWHDRQVLQVLDERDALLKAAARLDAWIARTISGDLGPDGREALAAFRGAIAKAAAP